MCACASCTVLTDRTAECASASCFSTSLELAAEVRVVGGSRSSVFSRTAGPARQLSLPARPHVPAAPAHGRADGPAHSRVLRDECSYNKNATGLSHVSPSGFAFVGLPALGSSVARTQAGCCLCLAPAFFVSPARYFGRHRRGKGEWQLPLCGF